MFTTMHPMSIPETSGEFIINIASPRIERPVVQATSASSSSSSALTTSVPITHLPLLPSHANPLLLDGFSLDVAAGGEPVAIESRKRKSMSPSFQQCAADSSPSTSSFTSHSHATEIYVQIDASDLHQKKKRKSTSLRVRIDGSSPASSSSTVSPLSAGHSSPVLALLQESNSSSPVPCPTLVMTPPVASSLSKKERAEMKRHKAKMKLIRLEASIEALKQQLQQTAQIEAQATARANLMAAAAAEAARVASVQQVQQAQSNMVDSFFAMTDASESHSSIVPPLSPLNLGYASAHTESPVMGRSLRDHHSSAGGSQQSTPVVSAVSSPNESPICSLDDSTLHADIEQMKAAPATVDFNQLAQVQHLEHALYLRKMDAHLHYLNDASTSHDSLSCGTQAIEFLHQFIATGATVDAAMEQQLIALMEHESVARAESCQLNHDVAMGVSELAQLLIQQTRAQRAELQQQFNTATQF